MDSGLNPGFVAGDPRLIVGDVAKTPLDLLIQRVSVRIQGGPGRPFQGLE